MVELSICENDIRNLAFAMVRLHGEDSAADLARRYSERSEEDRANQQKWSAVAAFLQAHMLCKQRFSASDKDV